MQKCIAITKTRNVRCSREATHVSFCKQHWNKLYANFERDRFQTITFLQNQSILALPLINVIISYQFETDQVIVDLCKTWIRGYGKFISPSKLNVDQKIDKIIQLWNFLYNNQFYLENISRFFTVNQTFISKGLEFLTEELDMSEGSATKIQNFVNKFEKIRDDELAKREKLIEK